MKTITHTQRWKDHASHYIMEENGLGMVRVTDWGDQIFQISDLYVDQKYRNQNIGKNLLQQAIDLCKQQAEHGTIEIDTNTNSQSWVGEWYKKVGFKFIQSTLPSLLSDDIEYDEYKMSF